MRYKVTFSIEIDTEDMDNHHPSNQEILDKALDKLSLGLADDYSCIPVNQNHQRWKNSRG